MSKKKSKLWLGILSLGCIVGLGACSKKTPEEKSEWVQKRVQKKLELNEVQSAKLKDLADTVLASRAKMRADREKNYDRIEALLVADQVSNEDFTGLISPKVDQFNQEMPKVVNKFVAFHNALDSNQKQKLAKYAKKWRNHHRR